LDQSLLLPPPSSPPASPRRPLWFLRVIVALAQRNLRLHQPGEEGFRPERPRAPLVGRSGREGRGPRGAQGEEDGRRESRPVREGPGSGERNLCGVPRVRRLGASWG
jgi:hypothetical protein